MQAGLNRVELLGTITTDPELRQTQGGLAMLAVQLVTTVRYRDNAGTWKDKRDEHELSVFGARAEALSKLLRRGTPVFVEGSLASKSYVDRNGQQRRALSLNVANVLLLANGKGRPDESEDETG